MAAFARSVDALRCWP